MQAIIDDQGRVEIPRVLRDHLHLKPGSVVDLEPVGDGLQVTPSENGMEFHSGAVTFVREGSLLVLGGSSPLTLDDVNRAIDAGREERLRELNGEDAADR